MNSFEASDSGHLSPEKGDLVLMRSTLREFFRTDPRFAADTAKRRASSSKGRQLNKQKRT